MLTHSRALFLGTAKPAYTLLSRIKARLSLARERRRLADLDPHLLRDIGLDPSDAQKEAARPLWDAPDSWRERRIVTFTPD